MFSESLILDSLAIYKHLFTLYFPISHKIEKYGIILTGAFSFFLNT